MKVCAVDLETYHDPSHSVKTGKYKGLAYLYAMDPKTQIICGSFVWEGERGEPGETVCLFGEDALRGYIAARDWSDTVVVGHNMAEFDSIFLRWRLDMDPCMWACTLAMARPRMSKTVGLGLDALCRHFNLGGKESDILVKTRGRRLEDFTDAERAEMARYNVDDGILCLKLFRRLLDSGMSSKADMCIVDCTTRMMTDPQMVLDEARLDQSVADEAQARYDAFVDLSRKIVAEGGEAQGAVTLEKTLRSSDKMAGLLKSLGVDPPRKVSPSNPHRTTWAFAKTDEAFRDLTTHRSPAVAAACATKLRLGSDMLAKRADRLKAAQGAHPGGRLPVLLRASGADTTGRWSAWGKTNMQNLPRVDGSESDVLRKSISAPEGHELVVVDATAIELRINHTLWQEESSMELFAADPGGADVYREFAGKALYDKRPEDVTPEERGVGKVAQLQLGYQSGAATLCAHARQRGVNMSLEQAQQVTAAWRTAYPRIVNAWRHCTAALLHMKAGATDIPLDRWGLCLGQPDGVSTPGGYIMYPDLKLSVDKFTGRQRLVYRDGDQWVDIYGGKMVANIVQHLARQIFAGYVLAIKARLGQYPGALVHDEVLAAYLAHLAQWALDQTLDIMRQSPAWWPQLTLWAEGGRGTVYGDIK